MKYGLIGASLSHSYSRQIHMALGNSDYGYFELSADELAAFMKRRDFLGVNITIPYKIEAMKYCDFISDEAKKIGCVNTIINKNGALYGFNTDYFGFDYMTAGCGISFADKKTVILGSGGTSMTVRAVAKDRGAREIVIISRGGADNYENIDRHYDCDILVNTTPVGMFPNMNMSPVSLDKFSRLCGVADVIYNPSKTTLLCQAKSRRIPFSNGLPMLVAQAKYAHELFFDTRASDAVIKSITRSLRLEMCNIILTGMPGSGKTTIGRLLALHFGRRFVDTDEEIEKAVGMPAGDYLVKYGEENFRKTESLILEKAEKNKSQVIATGGGAVIREENRAVIMRNSIVIGLDNSDELLCTENRPLSSSVEHIRKLRYERESLYAEVADVRITVNRDPRITLKKVLEYI